MSITFELLKGSLGGEMWKDNRTREWMVQIVYTFGDVYLLHLGVIMQISSVIGDFF